jgi:hypothetical protein
MFVAGASILATKEEKKTSILEVACRNREMKDFEMMPLAYLHQFLKVDFLGPTLIIS